MGILTQLTTDQFRAAQHVAPLVIAAKLHIAAVMLEQVVEVVRLHGHVVKFQERQAFLHSLLEALCTEHVVDREAAADLTDKVDIVQLQQPVCIVDHLSLAFTEFDKPLHLLFKAVAVVLNGLHGHHAAHIGTTGRIADHGGTTTNQRNRLVAGHLQPLHQAQCHEMAYMERISCGIKANIEGGLAVIDHFTNFFFIGNLCDQTTGNQLVINFHMIHSFQIMKRHY